MARIMVDITADDQTDGELAARLIAASLNTHGFDDVTNNSHPTHIDMEEDVVEAMRNLNPNIFSSEVTIEVSTFEDTSILAGVDQPGDNEYPNDNPDDDDDSRDPLED